MLSGCDSVRVDDGDTAAGEDVLPDAMLEEVRLPSPGGADDMGMFEAGRSPSVTGAPALFRPRTIAEKSGPISFAARLARSVASRGKRASASARMLCCVRRRFGSRVTVDVTGSGPLLDLNACVPQGRESHLQTRV